MQQDVILGRQLNVGDRLPTFRELSIQFEVSTSTIKEAFDILCAMGLIEKKRGSGCFLKRRPKAENSKKTLSVLMLMPSYAKHSAINRIEEGVLSAAEEHGVIVDKAGSTSYAEEKSLILGALARYDALLVYPLPRTSKQLRHDYLRKLPEKYPLVILDLAPPNGRFKKIIFDNYNLGYAITRRLIRDGHKRIAFNRLKHQSREIYHRSNDDRYQGYLRALSEFGLPFLPEFAVEEEFSTRLSIPGKKIATEFLAKWLATSPTKRPTAIICLEDEHAATLIQLARGSSVKIPEQLRVVGFDNIASAATAAGMPFPTSCPDFLHMGRLGIQTLLRQIRENNPEPETYLLPVQIKWPTAET